MDNMLSELHALSIPSSEEELRAAIAFLKASTRAADRRTKIITSQSALAGRLRSSNAQIGARRTSYAHYIKQKETREVQHIKFANEQLLDSLGLDLRVHSDENAKAVKVIPATVTEVLNTDDRVLAELNDLSANYPPNNADINSTRERVTKLNKTLRHFRTQTIKDRLDRTYLESLEASHGDDPPLEVSDASAADVQGDLGSLYGEIEDLVTIIMSQEHDSGIEQTLQDIVQIRERDRQSLNEHLHGILSSLTDRNDTLANGLDSLQSQETTLEDMSSQLQRLMVKSHADQDPALRTGTPEVKDSHPALFNLLEHLGCSQDNPTSPHGQLERLGMKLARKAEANVAQVLKVSQETPEMTRTALRDIGAALASNSSHITELDALQRCIDAAGMNLEQISS
ncbi:hypothetical protein EDD37DRAFT_265039 [Exophiala viscosa]|uniref:uncharacterized protein n=1 Tax=Exophiala viscosa TaxID=2486360 RepID=UPI0021A07C92|nr:hypothetical protein EDD37DRAFT_265039 [Exophiala viscosa]